MIFPDVQVSAINVGVFPVGLESQSLKCTKYIRYLEAYAFNMESLMVGFFGKRATASELNIPGSVLSDPSAFEVLRVWNTAKGLSVVLKSDVWSDPAEYGIMLADLARHIANAYFQTQGRDVSVTLSRILEGLNVELNSPTDAPTGELESKKLK